MELYLSGIAQESIVDGPGVRFTVFTQGCAHKCRGCHNPSTHSFTSGGYYETTGNLMREIMKNPLISGVTFSGGDPLYQSESCAHLAAMLKQTGMNIWVYTGFLWEEVKGNPLMEYTDVLVDGPFIESEKSLELYFKGSKNQRLIDVQESIRTGKFVIHNPEYAAL